MGFSQSNISQLSVHSQSNISQLSVHIQSTVSPNELAVKTLIKIAIVRPIVLRYLILGYLGKRHERRLHPRRYWVAALLCLSQGKDYFHILIEVAWPALWLNKF